MIMAQPTEEQILNKAGHLTPPPNEFPDNRIEIEVEFYEGKDITYTYVVTYLKQKVANTPGWKAIDLRAK
ncbi:hypothetical protein SAMN05428947_103415 [Mucilaginibacter sp. OK283]|nr:hypothetical protein SAMN05428947_103415 [Mucilaginibacter sp. OK283]